MLDSRITSASACEPEPELVRLVVSASPASVISVSSSLVKPGGLENSPGGGVPARVAAASQGARPMACNAEGPPASAISFSPGLISGSSIETPRPDESKSGPG
jgi:hypothetical protein